MAEEGWTDNEIARLAIHEYVKDFKDIDSLVLGCTHYPLFKNLIENELPNKIDVINTGEMVSKYLKEYLKENNMKNSAENKAKYEIYLTDTECNFLNVANKLLQDDTITKNIKKI